MDGIGVRDGIRGQTNGIKFAQLADLERVANNIRISY